MSESHSVCRMSMTGMRKTAAELRAEVPSFICERAANDDGWFYFYDRSNPTKMLWETDGCCKWDARARFIDHLLSEGACGVRNRKEVGRS